MRNENISIANNNCEYIIFFRRFQTNIRIFNRMIDTSNFVCNYYYIIIYNMQYYAYEKCI